MAYAFINNRMGRDMTYDCWSCDLICAASSPDLYRINLEQVCLAAIYVPVFLKYCNIGFHHPLPIVFDS